MKKIYLLWSKVLFLLLVTTGTTFSQTYTVTGKVNDAKTGDGLAGVNVIIKGTSQGTVTSTDGSFTLNLSSAVTLHVSFIGYRSAEVQVSSSTTTVEVSLEEDITSLEEVVVSGLATSVKRSNLANAVATVSSKELLGNTSQSTMDGALYGKLTGVNITASSGAPGGGFAMRLRGISSINGNNQPLFIVDGVYINNSEIPSGLRFASGANRGNEENSPNRLADINPSDIENIEILKGASAAAIYGTRANAGVVIITTKRGKQGKTNVNFSQDFGFNSIINKLGMRKWDATKVETVFGASERTKYEAAAAAGKIYDYEDILYGEKGFISESRISVSGGNDKTNFYIGGTIRDEDGIVKNTGYKRQSIRTNIDHKLSKVFEIGSSTSVTLSESQRSFTGNENEGGLSYGYNLAFTRPWADLFPDENGNYPFNPNSSGNMLLVRDQAENDDQVVRLIQGLKLTANVFQNTTNSVKLALNGGLDYFTNETFIYVPETHQAQQGNNNGFIGVGKNVFRNYNYILSGLWDHFSMDGQLTFTTQGGISYLNFDRNFTYAQATQLIPGQKTLGQSSAQSTDQTLEAEEEFGLFFQEEVNYKDRIIGTVGYRVDKSTLNGDQNKFYGFPKASVAVNLSNFDFFEVPGINTLKVRAAYGETGSSAQFGSIFTTLGNINIGGQGGSTVGALRGDPNLKPETSAEFETGLDVSALDGKIGLEFSYYNREVRDLILTRSLPTSTGFSQERTNLADLVNKGFEIALVAKPVNTSKISWTTRVNFWRNRSEVTRLDVPPFPQPGAGFGLGLGTFYIEEGRPVTQLKGNVNGVPTTIGDVEPDFQMSFPNEVRFLDNFEFGFLLHWKKGGNNLNLSRLLSDLGETTPDLDTPEGIIRQGQGFVATRFVEPAGYVRLREISLYYNLPKSILSPLKMQNAKIGVSGRNLWTKTDYSSYDPEVSTNGGAGLSSGIEVTPFPSSKQVYFHISVNF
jgi:TonB-dependent starch-binding outer membrane protein SusC